MGSRTFTFTSRREATKKHPASCVDKKWHSTLSTPTTTAHRRSAFGPPDLLPARRAAGAAGSGLGSGGMAAGTGRATGRSMLGSRRAAIEATEIRIGELSQTGKMGKTAEAAIKAAINRITTRTTVAGATLSKTLPGSLRPFRATAGPPLALEVTQGQILSQSPTDATSSR